MCHEARFRAAALSAFQNAQTLLDDVSVLYEADRWPRAVSLSVIGLEELGKAVIYTVAALDLVPGLKGILTDAPPRDDPVRDHRFKQVAAEFASIAHFMLEDAVYEADAGAPDLVEWLDATLLGCSRWLAESGVVDGFDARKAHLREQDAWRVRLREGLPAPMQEHEDPEARKWRGLYVDVTADEIRSPSTLGEYDARSARLDLGVPLEALWRLEAALESDAVWETLRRGRAANGEVG